MLYTKEKYCGKMTHMTLVKFLCLYCDDFTYTGSVAYGIEEAHDIDICALVLDIEEFKHIKKPEYFGGVVPYKFAKYRYIMTDSQHQYDLFIVDDRDVFDGVKNATSVLRQMYKDESTRSMIIDKPTRVQLFESIINEYVGALV